MKRILICVESLILLLLVSCAKSDDFFAGTMCLYDNSASSISLPLKSMKKDTLYSDYFAVVDSVIIERDMVHNSYFFHIRNLLTGQHLGDFVPYGHGHGEIVSVGDVADVFIENGQYKTVVNDGRKVFVWNISQSLVDGRTVWEEGYDAPATGAYGLFYTRFYKLNNDRYLTYTPSVKVGEQILLPQYYVYDLKKQKEIDRFLVVQKGFDKSKGRIIPESFFTSHKSLSPDRKKLVEAMCYLSQINIIDVATGTVRSFREPNTPDCSLFETSMKDEVIYYGSVASTDNYIFALYFGKNRNQFRDGCSQINVFDWDGNLVSKIELRYSATSMWLDAKNNVLYTYNSATCAFCAYDVSDLIR